MSNMYHSGSRALQDQFDSRRFADRLALVKAHTTIDADDRTFIEHSAMFFLATADAEGRPQCSYKGGLPGFVRVVDERILAFPNYDGDGSFKSLGNILVNPHVGLLFIDFEHPERLRINGSATVHDDDPLLSAYPGSQLIVRVRVERVFPNCQRYIHKMQLVKYSAYVPRPGYTPPVPLGKKMKVLKETLRRWQRHVRAVAKMYLTRVPKEKEEEHVQ
jgi:uncharacterized protein